MDLNNLDKTQINFDDKDNFSYQKIHLRKTQRNGRKCMTTVEGLAEELDKKKITRALKRVFKCNGAIVKDEKQNEIIQLSGDQRINVKDFLIEQQIEKEDDVVIH
jgi:translation initiation factor 1